MSSPATVSQTGSMQVRHDQKTLLRESIVTEKRVEPVSTARFARQPAEAGVIAISRIERKEFPIRKGRFADEVDEPAVEIPEFSLCV